MMQMKQLFREIDEDGSGFLEADEVRQLVARLGKRLTDKELAGAMREMDEDGGDKYPPNASLHHISWC